MGMHQRPKCEIPGCNNPAMNRGYNKKKEPTWRKSSWVSEISGGDGYVCRAHHTMVYNMNGSYLIHRKKYCENQDGRLGFYCTTSIIDPTWQLDVDHIDGNSANNNPHNLQTLCKCCHSMKSKW